MTLDMPGITRTFKPLTFTTVKFDNETTIYGIHNIKLVMAIIVVIFIVLMLITSLPEFIERNIGLSMGWALGIVIGGYFLFFTYFILKGTAYVSYNDEGSKIIIRTFKIHPFASQKMSFEIPREEIYRITVEKRFLREELNIYVRKENRISKYPSISVVSIIREQKTTLIQTLRAFAEIKE